MDSAQAVPKRSFWKASVCTAFLSGQRTDEATEFRNALRDFRLHHRRFVPDIREAKIDMVIGGEKDNLKFEVPLSVPALVRLNVKSAAKPTPKVSEKIAQRAYGIEYDLDRNTNTTFIYGYALRGAERIREHLRALETRVGEHAPEVTASIAKQVAPWRGAALICGAVCAYSAFKFSIHGPIPKLIDLGYFVAAAYSEVSFYTGRLFGWNSRSHAHGFADHWAFIRRGLKTTDISEERRQEALDAQTLLDRESVFENAIRQSRRRGSLQVHVPAGPFKRADFDQIFFFDEQTHEPVYLFVARFFNDRIDYPKKPRKLPDVSPSGEWRTN